MVYGNHVAVEILDKIKGKIKNNELNSGFFLVAGPKNIGKKTLILNIVKDLEVLPQDLLIIEDPGKKDGKNYTIKVDEDEKNKILEIEGKRFIQMGARQIADFLSTTSFGKYKVVFIENIERMNISAANALLKILEEPPKGVFIFATVSNKTKILPTILSRASIINMFETTKQEFKDFLDENMIVVDEKKLNILYAISGGRIGLAKNMLEEHNEMLDKVEEFLQLDEKTVGIESRFSLLKEFIQDGKINLFLDALIFYYSHTNKFDKVQKLVDIKNKNYANVNLENLLFAYLLD